MNELVPRTEVDVLDIDTATDFEDVMEAVKKNFGGQAEGKAKVNITSYMELPEEIAARLIRTGHLNVGWVRADSEKRRR